MIKNLLTLVVLDIYRHGRVRNFKQMFSDNAMEVFGYRAFARQVEGRVKGKHITLHSASSDKFTPCVNMGSYDYLGLSGEDSDSNTTEKGNQQQVICDLLCQMLEKKHCSLFNTGYAANAVGLAQIIANVSGGKIIVYTDKFNHASIIQGISTLPKLVDVEIFSHANLGALERKVAAHGDNTTAFVIFEGVYSVHGDFIDVARLVQIKKQAAARVILICDEAHSFGCVGRRGLGVCEEALADVDVIVGTFSKSMNTVGGFVATNGGDITLDPPHEVQMRNAITEAVLAERLTALFNGGMEARLTQLRKNAVEMWTELRNSLGERAMISKIGSPVICFNGGNIELAVCFSEYCLENGFGITLVGYPAAGMLELTVRLCMSAAHTSSTVSMFADVVREFYMQGRRAKGRRVVDGDACASAADIALEQALEIKDDADRTSYLVQQYGYGNSGPRMFMSNLSIFRGIERRIASNKNVDDAAIMSCTISGAVTAFDYLVTRHRRVLVVVREDDVELQKIVSMVMTYASNRTRNKIDVVDKAEDAPGACILLRESSLNTGPAISEHNKIVLFESAVSKSLSPKSMSHPRLIACMGPLNETTPGFYIASDEIRKHLLSLRGYVFTATRPVHEYANLIGDLM